MSTAPLPSEQGFARSKAAASGQRVVSDEAIAGAHARLYATFKSGRTRTVEWRRTQLESLRRMLSENGDAICEALQADLGRPRMEALIADSAPVIAEIDFALQHLEAWMKPEWVPTPFVQQPGRSQVVREPKGVVLNIAPWNFPVQLALLVSAQALAAGNCVLLKPSELAPATEAFFMKYLPKYIDPEALIVVPGGIPEATALLRLRWDHIFFTGNGAVGRVVLTAAAQHLTPCTLELGGKTPTVVLPGANLRVAAKRILSGKLLNAGQICISPDYALVHKDIEEALVAELRSSIQGFYGEDASKSPSLGRIVNDQHWCRVRGLVDSAGGEIIQWGEPNREQRFIPPTLIRGPHPDSEIMREEIFGPVLPMVKMESLDAMVDRINADEKPLALYIFGAEADAEEIIRRTSSGTVCVNDTILHAANPDLPFGGVGGSGIGRYHGKFGFDELSHLRGVMYRKSWLDPSQRYPPYTETNLKMFHAALVGPLLPPGVKKALAASAAAAVAAAGLALRSRL